MSEFDKLNQYFLNDTNHIINRSPVGVSKILDLCSEMKVLNDISSVAPPGIFSWDMTRKIGI